MDNNYLAFSLMSLGESNDKLKDIFQSKLMHGYRFTYSYDSFFGPLGATIGYSSRTKKPYLYINLGYEF